MIKLDHQGVLRQMVNPINPLSATNKKPGTKK